MLKVFSIFLSLLIMFQPAVLMAKGADTSVGKTDELYVKIYLANHHQTYQSLLNQMKNTFPLDAVMTIRKHMVKGGVKLNSKVAQPTIENGQLVVYKTKSRTVTMVQETKGLAAYDGREYWYYETAKSLDSNYFSLLNYLGKKSVAKASGKTQLSDLFFSTAQAGEEDVKKLEESEELQDRGIKSTLSAYAFAAIGTFAYGAGAVSGLLVAGVLAPVAFLLGLAFFLSGYFGEKDLTNPLFQCNDLDQVTFMVNGKRIAVNDSAVRKTISEKVPKLMDRYDTISALVSKSNQEVCGDSSKRGDNLQALNKEFLRLYGKNDGSKPLKSSEGAVGTH